MTIELCGDVPLSTRDRLRYLWRNALRNVSAIGQRSASRSFRPDLAHAHSAMIGQSPGRLMSELFIEQELPILLPPRRIEMLEIGCGSGSMSRRLARLGYGGRYTGVDIQDRFVRADTADFPFDTEFVQSDARAFQPARPIDLMVSVSTLEHIPDDAALISRFRSFFKPGGIELHLVPSGASLAVYLLHGYRQYTPAALAKLFGENVEIVRLGGLASFLVHIGFITAPDLIFRSSLRSKMPAAYSAALRFALRADRLLPICPTAYAVIRRH